MWSSAVTLLLVIIRFMIHVDFTMAVSSWNMHDLCGANLDIYEAAGKLLFDANELPVNLPGNACELTITSSSAHSNKMMIMFYFTQFMFSDSCDDSNVKFINGASNNSSTVPDLPRYLCSNSRRTEQVYFKTSGKNLKIVFTKSQLKFRNVFTVVLVPYFIGSCLSDTVHKCSNGRCIFVNDACLYDVNSCGSEDLTCYTDDTTTQSPNQAFTGSQVAIAFGFFLFVGVSFICFFRKSGALRRFLSRVKGCFTSTCELCSSCWCGVCRGLSECCVCTGTTCARRCRGLRTNCGTLYTNCVGSCRKCIDQQCTNSEPCPSNQSHQEPVVNHVDGGVTLQLPAEQLPPSYQSIAHYQSDSEFNTSNDSHPAAHPVVYLSVEDPPPSYDDIMAQNYRK